MTLPAKSSFFYVTCQPGVEDLIKAHLCKSGDLKFAFSRPGFLTFKLSDDEFGTVLRAAQLFGGSPFIRSHGWSIGRVQGAPNAAANEMWEKFGGIAFDRLHIWTRTPKLMTETPSEGEEKTELDIAREAIHSAAPTRFRSIWQELTRQAELGETVLDCVIVEPESWWIGWHNVHSSAGRLIGGMPQLERPDPFISRAYYKLEEGLKWSGLSIQTGDLCVEIGSAPGGAAQALLNRGAKVIGIDPAEMHPHVAENPHFKHLKMRGSEVAKRDLAGAKWLFADSNVAPTHTLDSVEGIATNRRIELKGLLLTLKFTDWRLLDELPNYVQRVKSWGFHSVQLRHLTYNRQELCLFATK